MIVNSNQKLATRIVAASIIALCLMLAMIAGTLWLSWQQEGAAAAINDAGSLRMRATKVALQMAQALKAQPNSLRQEVDAVDATLAGLRLGNPVRPLLLPNQADIQTQFQLVERQWRSQLRGLALAARSEAHYQAYFKALPGFVGQADHLVSMIEQDNARRIGWLRLSQGALALMAGVGTLAMIYLLYLWIILPLMSLQDGILRMSQRDFAVRLNVESNDEFGQVAEGFNQMAAELAGLYAELEQRVAHKTAQLAAQNRELGALYSMAAFLNLPGDVDGLCRGFLQRVMQQFGADGGSIRVVDGRGDKLHLLVSEGLSEDLQESEHCMQVDACLCGQATSAGVVVVRDFRKLPKEHEFGCHKQGFAGVAVFQIRSPEAVLGSFSLHFKQARELPACETQLLETLGQHLGVALENQRLGAKARQLAIAEERNLVAQGLHDSIAQSLNFLNLQVQMLEDALTRSDMGELQEIAPLLRAGVEESYQDVRELLLNFRSKLGQGELEAAIKDTVARFQRQSGVAVQLAIDEEQGAPLPAEQQLQVLFILQEALSNVRKHAQAGQVWVKVHNARDFYMSIRDDGQGYDGVEVAARTESHIGLRIMHERAARIHAELKLEAMPGKGASVELRLAQTQRQAA